MRLFIYSFLLTNSFESEKTRGFWYVKFINAVIKYRMIYLPYDLSESMCDFIKIYVDANTK